MRRPGGDDQIVEGDVVAASRPDHPLAGKDSNRFLENDRRVLLSAQDRADGARDVGRIERRRSDLVEERLEEMVVAAVEKRHAHGGAPELSRGVQAGEPAAEDHDMRKRRSAIHRYDLRHQTSDLGSRTSGVRS